MNKLELIEKVVKESEVAKKDVTKVLDSILGTIGRTLKKGDKITFVGFGTFSVSKRKARKGRNPRTGAAIKIAAAKLPKFSAGAPLKTLVNGGK